MSGERNGSAKVEYTVKEILEQMREEQATAHEDIKKDIAAVRNDVRALQDRQVADDAREASKRSILKGTDKLVASGTAVALMIVNIPGALWYWHHS